MKHILYRGERTGCRLLWYAAVIGMLAVIGIWNGCGIEKTDGNKISDLAYELVEEDDLPSELKSKIDEKKAADFKLTYECDNDLYVARGYGEQETGGYSIQILESYITQNAIVFKTGLVGPAKDETKNTAPSYPYIVIKTDNQDKNVIFQ